MVKYSRTIKSISYLQKDDRVRISVNELGKFPIGLDISVYPDELMELDGILKNDPALTLVDGDKIRVFYGGCSDQMLVQASGIIDNHIIFYKTGLKEKPSAEDASYDWRDWSDYFGYTRGSD